ncbi:MAG: ankyrin repeat domain-containing protein [Acidobacteriota bacterium]|jgi:ankyrin repeat protein
MLLQNRNHKYLWIVQLMIAVTGLYSSISIAQEQADPAGEKLSALTVAVTSGDIAEVRRLLDTGVDINPTTDNEATPLILASRNGHTEIVRLLLDAGANANANPFKYTPHRDWEVSYTPTALLPMILQSEISYDATALHAASQNGHIEIVRLLLEAGAKVDAQGNDDATALHAASQNGHAEIVKLLLEAGANVDAEITRAFYREMDHLLDSMMVLESLHPPMAVLNYHTPLILASQNGNVEIVKLLLEAGAKVNAATYAGTAVGAASQNGHVATAKLLIESGADVNAATMDNVTALHLASQNGHLEIVKLLLDSGVNINTKGEIEGENYTALDLADINGHTAIVKILKEYIGKQ